MSSRRQFITLVGGAVAARPFASRAQQPDRLRRIGVLMGWAESHDKARSGVAALREELQKLGWTEGRNIEINTGWAAADVESMKRFAKSRFNLTCWLRPPHPLPRRCCNRHVPFRLFSYWLPIPSVAASSRTCRGQMAT